MKTRQLTQSLLLRRFPLWIISALCLVSATARAQGPAVAKVAVKTALVLTPEFCSSVKKQGDKFWTGLEMIELGKTACTELEPALRGVFTSLTTVNAPPTPDAGYRIMLVPRFADASATRPVGVTIFNKPTKTLDVELEWTAKDSSGKTLWIGTVQGAAEKRLGAMTNRKKALTELTESAIKDAGEKSAAAIASAPELQKQLQ